MSVILAGDPVELYAAGPLDPHGWREPGAEPGWRGPGNLQLSTGLSDPRAAGGGGRGPHGPAAAASGIVYLPPDAEPAEGMTAVIRGEPYVLSQVRFMADPNDPAGFLSCWVATVTGRRADG